MAIMRRMMVFGRAIPVMAGIQAAILSLAFIAIFMAPTTVGPETIKPEEKPFKHDRDGKIWTKLIA